MMNIPLSKPDTGELEIEQVAQVLRSRRLSLGPKLTEFESKFAEYVGTRYAVAVNSGTSALHLAVRALGIGPGDEVITTPFSFVASANCLLYEGASPVFVDIDPQTLNLDPRRIKHFLAESCKKDSRGTVRNKTTGRIVKGILPVHVFGLPCNMDSIAEVAQQFGLSILEDACEALGAKVKGRGVGTFGDAAVFAFYPNKQMTTGEGGMIVTDNEQIAKLCKSLRNQGRDDDSAWLRHIHLGFNYRLSELHCAVGLAQLARLGEFLAERERVAATYTRLLSKVPYIDLPATFPELTRSWFVYVVQLGPGITRDDIILKLRQRGIESQAYFPAIHKQPYMSNKAMPQVAHAGSLECTEEASARCLALPFFPSMKSEEIKYVSETLAELLKEEARPRGAFVASPAAAPEVSA